MDKLIFERDYPNTISIRNPFYIESTFPNRTSTSHTLQIQFLISLRNPNQI